MIEGFSKEIFTDHQKYLDMYMPEEFFEVAYRYSVSNQFRMPWALTQAPFLFSDFAMRNIPWRLTLEGSLFWQEIYDGCYNADLCNINPNELKDFIDFKPFK
jgi:hypothetical protein